MNFTVFSTFQVDYSVSWRPNGKYIQLDQSCLVVWGKSMSQKLSFLLGKKRLKNVFHWLIWSYVSSHKLVESYIHISAHNILMGLWAWNNSTIYGSHLVFLRQVFMIISQVSWIKSVFSFLSHAWRVLLLSETSHSYIHTWVIQMNGIYTYPNYSPRQYIQHGVSRRYIPTMHSSCVFFAYQPQKNNSSTIFFGWMSGSSVFLQSLLGIASTFGAKKVFMIHS